MEPGKDEEFVTSDDAITWLENWVSQLDYKSKDLANYNSSHQAAKHLVDTACQLKINAGFTVQWFAVRLDPSIPEELQR